MSKPEYTTRICRYCDQPKSIFDFPLCRGKRFWKCKACASETNQQWIESHREKSRLIKRRYDANHPERAHLSRRKYQNSNRKSINAKNAIWKSNNAEKRQCHTAVSNAIMLGHLVRKSCEVCGTPDAQAHHEDYSKPFEIKWLCPHHHMLLHRERERRIREGV